MDGEKQEWTPPPIPEKISAEVEKPQMSEIGTLGSIFIEPGATFEDLRRKPRFVMGLIILIVLTTAFTFAFSAKIGEDGMRRFINEQFDKNPQAASMPADQKSSAIEMQLTIQKGVSYAMPVLMILGIALLSLFYWLGSKAFGGTGNYFHAVSVWIYSSIPPTVVAMIANFLVLFLKSADEIDIATASRGLVSANPSFLIDGKAMPVVATLLSVIDIFAIWGWILASIGLQKTNKISAGSAWAITIVLALIGVTFRVLGAVFSGNPS
jgi:hypothetical protein